jgi:spoIIIJ-associated protein
MTDRKFFSGNTVEQALMKAARFFEIPADELEYHPIEKKHGFLRVRRSVVIEVDASAPRRAQSEDGGSEKDRPTEPEEKVTPRETEAEPEASATPHETEAEPEASVTLAETEAAPETVDSAASAPARHEAEGATVEAAAEAIQILLKLAGAEMEISVTNGDERLEAELSGVDEDLLLKSQGRPLLAIQHLTPRLIRGLTGESAFCRVDCDGFHEIREERLRDLAQRVASEVSQKGRSRLLESMAPDERRIVHMTLADDPNVTTESQGSGFLKRVKVLPA